MSRSPVLLAVRAALGALALAATAVSAAPPKAAPGPAPSRDEVARAERQGLLLKQQAELSQGKNFYLILDPRQRTLTLFLRGATLQTWKLAGLEVGAPRIAFVSRGLPEDWEGRIWSNGSLDPERKIDRYELQAPPPTEEGTEQEIPIPPTPEEKYPVPPRYHIRFDGGLSIEVIPPGPQEAMGFFARLAARLTLWWHDAKQAMSSSPEDRIRLRLVLSAKDADSVYRCLPPETKLLVVPPQS